MPEPVNPVTQQLREILQAEGTSSRRIREILTQAVREVGDQFITDGTLGQAIDGLDQRLQQSIITIAQRLLPPPQLRPGITMPHVNAARILHSGRNRPDAIDNNWASAMVNLRGSVFNVGDHNPMGLIAWGLSSLPPNATVAQQGQALAANFWSDSFFSSMELAAVFMHAQTLQGEQKTQFQNAFAQEYVQQIQTRFQNPQQQRYIMMQMLRFLANTNWAGNEGFRDFTNSLTNEMVRTINPYHGLRTRLETLPLGQRVVVQTYDLPGERRTYGAAVMLAYRDAAGNIQTEVIRHRPGANENLWRFNFPAVVPQIPQPQPPQFPPIPGWGNWPPNWPVMPAPGWPGGGPQNGFPPQPPWQMPPQVWPQPPQWIPPLPPVAPPAVPGVGGVIPPRPVGRPEAIHNQLVLQQTQLRLIQQQLQGYIQQRINDLPVGDPRREQLNNVLTGFQQLINRFNTIVRTGGNDTQNLRTFAANLNRFNNQHVVTLDNPSPPASDSIGNFVTNLNRIAGESAIDTATHRNSVNGIRREFNEALEEIGIMSEEDKDLGTAISNTLEVYSDLSRPVRPDEAEKLRELTNRMRQYSNRLITAYGENQGARTMQGLANRLDTIAGNLVGVNIPPPPGGPTPVSINVGRMSSQTLRYLFENGFDIATPEITAENINTARDEMIRLMRSYSAVGTGGVATGMNAENGVRLFNFMLRYMQAISNYYQNNYGDNAETVINNVMHGVSDWGTAINRYTMFRNDMAGA